MLAGEDREVINGINNEGVICTDQFAKVVRDAVCEMDLAVGIGIWCVGPSAVVVIAELTGGRLEVGDGEVVAIGV